VAIEAGRTLSHYRLVEKLGQGGMGQVWLARDDRLGRDVAVKVLPEGFATSEAYRQRFEREGRAISALNHPNICTLYDIGRDGETHYLVMERIEGESLSERLRRGPLPVEQVVEFGGQIASALAAAHRAGIVHRDLKPGNVMLTRTGAKLLDFGLARTADESGGGAIRGLTEAPTQHERLTQQGTILGTIQHMAPEQLEGLDADARTDIFALGTVLYEMATGRPAFEGATRTSLIAAIVTAQPPPIAELRPMTPPAFEHLVRQCLAKDREDRWQSAGDVAAQLRWISTQLSSSGASAAVSGRGRRVRRALPWMAAAAFAALSAVLGYAVLDRGPARIPALRAAIVPPAMTTLVPFDELGLALSPDGRRLAFVANEADGGKGLWIRDLDSATAERVPETRGAWYPFWSPDGVHLGFFADGFLKTVDLRGGSPRVVAEAPSGRGGTWNRDDVILFSPRTRSAIERVAAAGGTPEPVTPFDPETETTNRWPHFLPDGRHFLYVSRAPVEGRGETGRLMLASLDSPDVRVLIEDSTNAAYVEPGFILFGRGGDLLARRFDPDRLEFVGEPIPLTADKASFWEPKNYVPFSVSDDGTIVYLPEATRPSVLRWYDRAGTPLETIRDSGFHTYARASPDGNRVAWVQGQPQSGKQDVWVRDLSLDRDQKLTLESSNYGDPAWSPDGRQLAFTCQPKRVQDVCVKTVDAGGPAAILYESKDWSTAGNWTRGGLVLVDQDPETDNDIWLLDPASPGSARRIVHTPADETDPRLSEDGRWLAFTSDATGRTEVYVREMRDDAQTWQISFDGGSSPQWSRNGAEVVYVTPEGAIAAVAIETRPTFRASPPRVLFALRQSPDYVHPLLDDVTADGRRLLLNLPVEGPESVAFHAIFHWTSSLEK